MVPIPPPPLPQSSGPWAPPSPSHAADGSGSTAFDGLLPGQTTAGWRRVLQVGWVLIIITLAAVGAGSDRLGKPTWWLEPPVLAVIPLTLPVAAMFLSLINSRLLIPLGWAASIVIAATAVLDITGAPGAAAVEGALAFAGLLITTSALAGRLPRS